MQKVTFQCDDCNAEVTVRLGDDYDDYSVVYCPCCAAPIPATDDED